MPSGSTSRVRPAGRSVRHSKNTMTGTMTGTTRQATAPTAHRHRCSVRRHGIQRSPSPFAVTIGTMGMKMSMPRWCAVVNLRTISGRTDPHDLREPRPRRGAPMPTTIDIYDPDLYVEGPIHEIFAELRRTDPVHWQDMPGEPGYWAVLKHEYLRTVAKHPEIFRTN